MCVLLCHDVRVSRYGGRPALLAVVVLCCCLLMFVCVIGLVFVSAAISCVDSVGAQGAEQQRPCVRRRTRNGCSLVCRRLWASVRLISVKVVFHSFRSKAVEFRKQKGSTRWPGREKPSATSGWAPGKSGRRGSWRIEARNERGITKRFARRFDRV